MPHPELGLIYPFVGTLPEFADASSSAETPSQRERKDFIYAAKKFADRKNSRPLIPDDNVEIHGSVCLDDGIVGASFTDERLDGRPLEVTEVTVDISVHDDETAERWHTYTIRCLSDADGPWPPVIQDWGIEKNSDDDFLQPVLGIIGAKKDKTPTSLSLQQGAVTGSDKTEGVPTRRADRQTILRLTGLLDQLSGDGSI